MAEWETIDLANPTEEHRMLREMVRDFVREEVEPQALEYDREEKFNLDLFRKLGEIWAVRNFRPCRVRRFWDGCHRRCYHQ